MYYRTAIVYPDGQESVVAHLPNLKVAYKYHRHYEDYVVEQFKKKNPIFFYGIDRVYVAHDDFNGKTVYCSYIRDTPVFSYVAKIVTSRCDETAD